MPTHHLNINFFIVLVYILLLVARDRPIMLIFLPIMLCCSAQIFDLLCSILCSCKRIMLKI